MRHSGATHSNTLDTSRPSSDTRDPLLPGRIMPRHIPRLLAFLAVILAAGAATAADIKVMISAGFFNVYADLGPAFEKLTGHKLITTRGPSVGNSPEAIPTRLTRGEGADVVIMDGDWRRSSWTQRGVTPPRQPHAASRSRSSAWWFERVSPSPTSARSRRCERHSSPRNPSPIRIVRAAHTCRPSGSKSSASPTRSSARRAQGAWTAFGGTGGCSRCSRRGGGRLPAGSPS